jgi:hypothetical protein
MFYRSRKSGKTAEAKAKNVKEQDPEVGLSSEQLMAEVDHSDYHNSETQMVTLKKQAATEVGEGSEQETVAADEEEGDFDDVHHLAATGSRQ